MIKKLKRKFILVTIIVVVLVIGTIIGTINTVNYRNMKKELNKILDVLEENDGKMPLPPFLSSDSSAMQLSPEVPYQTRYFTVLYNDDGEIEQINLNNVFSVSEEDAKQYAQSVEGSGFINDYQYREITTSDNKKMTIFLNCGKELYSFKNFLKTSLTISLTAIAVISVLVILLSSAIIKPIEQSYNKQKRFITDASHEIKTPLAIIGASNEVVEMEYGQSEWTNTISSQIQRLNTLTEKLVFLSKTEESIMPSLSEFNLSKVAEEIAQSFNSVAQIQEKSFTIDIQPDLFLVGDETLIGQALTLLLDNAFKYSNAKGEIILQVSRCLKGNRITLKNTVDNIRKGNLDKLFDRFYREDVSRNSETDGNGIGLSIVQAIVSLHKGKVAAFSADGKTVEFTVLLS